jgi:hypothetical protein
VFGIQSDHRVLYIQTSTYGLRLVKYFYVFDSNIVTLLIDEVNPCNYINSIFSNHVAPVSHNMCESLFRTLANLIIYSPMFRRSIAS